MCDGALSLVQISGNFPINPVVFSAQDISFKTQSFKQTLCSIISLVKFDVSEVDINS